MPEISRFYGIIIKMFFFDHLPPHFHAEYGEFKAKFAIENGEMIEGKLPRRAVGLVQDWIELHREELMNNYTEAQKQSGLIRKIEPLN
jgi:hypothetical protein